MLFGLILFSPTAPAHDIPNQVRLYGFVKPEGNNLHLLVRIPLVMLLNLDLPKRGPGFIALEAVDEGLDRAAAATAREVLLYEEGIQLAYSSAQSRISRASDESFGSFEQARAHIDGPPLASEADVFWNQGYFDAHLIYPIRSPQSNFALELNLAPGLAGQLSLILHYLTDDGVERVYQLHPGMGRIPLSPRWYQAAGTFVRLGFQHILSGTDHLLFLLCLVLPFRRRDFWTLVGVVSAFTVAHSVTLIAAALGLAPSGKWFPPLVETLIALSIVYMALENILAVRLNHRWMITGLFGLIHGFGFSFVLRQDMQLAGDHLLTALLSFNVGVELGQIAVLIAMLPLLGLLHRTRRSSRYGVIVVSALVAHTGWHWMLERFENLRRSDWRLYADFEIATVVNLLLPLMIVVAVGWLGLQMMGRMKARRNSTQLSGMD